jgi:Fur family ferric uptake transcriptional regulator
LLETMDMVYKLDFDDGCYRYELNRNKEDHRHHHLICLKCGCVEEVEEDLLETLENQILKNKGFVVKDHSVEFYGYCADCSIKYEEF